MKRKVIHIVKWHLLELLPHQERKTIMSRLDIINKLKLPLTKEENDNTCLGANETFMYFAYGSNLLAKRIHIQNPSAIRNSIGELKDHKLSFVGFTKRWGGAPATIVPTSGHSVWGAIWEIDLGKMSELDNQEGVAQNIYFAKTVDVQLADGQILSCRVYQRTVDPLVEGDDAQPYDKPSILYKETIVQGAVESNLPKSYIDFLKSIPHNGYHGQAEIGKALNINVTEIDSSK